MTGNEVRERFLRYFERNGHRIVRSSSLIPAKDPSLLFTNAGMVQFKNVFLGEEILGFTRATSSQKCLRVSGKHNDFENVGRTARHHTFFEMLGNFSFGDYFKNEAIRFGWEFLTEEIHLPKEKLYVTVYRDDNEAAQIWEKEMGVSPDRIYRMDESSNFWAMGETGPCGPCSEIIIDQGEEIGCGKPDCTVGCECDRFLELWNLVFMQFNRDESGRLTPLPKPSIDTGMGLERVTAVVQGKHNNYDTGLFIEIIDHAVQICGRAYGDDPDAAVSLRVIADHARAISFLIGDGILPSNEGRGYVLRRIMRRAARHGVFLGIHDPFLFKICGTVVDTMKTAYPELIDRSTYIASVVKSEEERFIRTLENGLRILQNQIEKMKSGDIFDGEFAFLLYDTFGFPLDLTQDILRDKSISVDEDGFRKSMDRQRKQSQAAWKGFGEERLGQAVKDFIADGLSSEFTGYQELKTESAVIGLIVNNEPISLASEGVEVDVITKRTPFYGEMGGQIGDAGKIISRNAILDVTDTKIPHPNLIIMRARVVKGTVSISDQVTLVVDDQRRASIARAHSATHLLHHALRKVLGQDAKQAGSLVAPDRLRFDFTHFEAVKPVEMEAIENQANAMVRENYPVSENVQYYDEAVREGAIALFGEKYSDNVRVVSMGLSKELCGGTHVHRTGDIGLIKVVAEGSVAAGVRRLEAVTGQAAIDMFRSFEQENRKVSELLKATPGKLTDRIEKLLAEHKALSKEIERMQAKLSSDKAGDLIDKVIKKNGINVLAVVVEIANAKTLRTMASDLLARLKSGVVVLGAQSEGKALLIAMVSDDLTAKIHAGNIISAAAKFIGGGGGGKPDMAQAGGTDPSGLQKALQAAVETVG